ncbi:MAG: alpha/beta hydrolase [Piscirickettsiaceae bacterium]|nr:alpha/beta hydrolase [Piscirickettsiaceae bacterium]
MKYLIAFFLSVCLNHVTAGSYDYPISEPYAATVLGTPLNFRATISKKVLSNNHKLVVFPNRIIPELFWYDDGLRYSLAKQKDRAPLIFIIAGTGGSHNSARMKSMEGAFYMAGFHVVLLSSPTHQNFIISASATSIPGHLEYDAKDIYHVMQLIKHKHNDEIKVSENYLTGYSLGGTQAAFISKLDEKEQFFKFKKVLMINPPVSLFNSVNILDEMAFNNIPGGPDNFKAYFDDLVATFADIYKTGNDLGFDDDFLYAAYLNKRPKDTRKIAALIGVSFRIAFANMVFTTDVMNNWGYIVPKNRVLTSGDSLTNYSIVAHRITFLQYFNELLFPFYQSKNPDLTREQMLHKLSLKSIEDYLKNSDKIGVMHNRDDLILAPGEIEYIQDIFQSRAKIYPKGGHLGNMEYTENVDFMLDFFNQ